MTLLVTILAFVVALGTLIIVHEFGHYLVARWCNVKILRFSVGFGRPLWSKALGHDRTEWAITAFPLGGYVKMLDEREGEVAPGDLPRAFNRQPVHRRIAVVVAGPVANFLLAVFLYWILFMHGVPGMKPVLGPVVSGTPAAVAGFTPGETIVRIEDKPVATWQDARWMLLEYAVQRARVQVEVREDGGGTMRRTLDLSGLSTDDLDSDFLKALGLTRSRPVLKPVIGRVVGNAPAERAGLKAHDEFVTINDQQTSNWEQVVNIIRSHPHRQLTVVVRRNGALLPAIAITPDSVTENGQRVGKIGAAPLIDGDVMAGLMTEVRYGPVESMARALQKTWDTSVFSLKMLGKMVIGQVSLKNLSGPITIADYAGQSAQSGWIWYLFFMALISISLGVLNLLPIPLLDGGHLMYYILEIFKGSPVSDKAIEIGQHVGMALLFTMMAFALYNDINRLISG